MILALAGQAQAETANQEEFPPLVQAFFGSLMLEDQSGDWKDIIADALGAIIFGYLHYILSNKYKH